MTTHKNRTNIDSYYILHSHALRYPGTEIILVTSYPTPLNTPYQEMASFEGLERDLKLKGIIELNHEELGCGAQYGQVYVVKYCETVCATKETHSILVEGVGQVQMQ